MTIDTGWTGPNSKPPTREEFDALVANLEALRGSLLKLAKACHLGFSAMKELTDADE